MDVIGEHMIQSLVPMSSNSRDHSSRPVRTRRETRWDDEQPREEGFYWYRDPEFDLRTVVRVYRSTEAGTPRLRASGTLVEGRSIDTMEGQWAGPISPPGPNGEA